MSSPHNNFDHQVFLFDIIDLILATSLGPPKPRLAPTPRTGGTPPTFISPLGIYNFSFSGNPNPFKSHTNTKQISVLRPQAENLLNDRYGGSIDFTRLGGVPKRIKVFKVFKDGEKEQFSLGGLWNSTGREKILVNSIDRGIRGAYVRSFEWEDLGTNPADTGFMFKSRMEIVCDNISEIFLPKTLPGGTKTISISDLFIPNGGRKNNSNPPDPLQSDFKIKVEIEYDNSDGYIQNRGIGEALKVNLLLNLVKHDIQINPNVTGQGGDARFIFTLEHIASIESDFLSTYGDLIKFKPGNVLIQKQIDIKERTIRAYRINLRNKKLGKAVKKGTRAQIKALKAEVKALKTRNKSSIAIGKLSQLKVLTTGIYNTIDLPRYTVDSFAELQQIDRTPKIDPSKGITSPPLRAAEQKRINQNALRDFKSNRSIILGAWNYGKHLNITGTRALLASGTNEKVNFFFLGDLLNNVIKQFNINVTSAAGSKTSSSYEFIIGNIPVFFPSSGKIKYISIADLPISSKFYDQWIQKQFVDSGAKTVKVITFIRELCSSLIYSVLNRMKFAAVNYPQIRVNYLVDINPSTGNQVFFLYASSFGDSTLIGDRQKDVEKGIFHLIPADPRISIIKKLDISRADLKGYREARIEESRDIASRNLLFSDAYEVKIGMPGNNCFKPGQIFYLDCTKIGFPGPSAYKSPIGPLTEEETSLQLPKNMRLQGYYTIIKVSNQSTFTDKDNKWDTQIEALFMGDPYGFEEIKDD